MGPGIPTETRGRSSVFFAERAFGAPASDPLAGAKRRLLV
jgi:hypothetical protein